MYVWWVLFFIINSFINSNTTIFKKVSSRANLAMSLFTTFIEIIIHNNQLFILHLYHTICVKNILYYFDNLVVENEAKKDFNTLKKPSLGHLYIF